MTKIEYLISSSYHIRPEPYDPGYQEKISAITNGIVNEYMRILLAKKDIPHSVLITLKEVVYPDLTYGFLDRTPAERVNLLKAYNFIITRGYEVINMTLSSSRPLREETIDQINTFISYTQFWSTIDWGDSGADVVSITNRHRKLLVVIGYRIIHLIVLNRISSEDYFRIAEKIFEIVGFINSNEISGVIFDDVLRPSDFHVIRYDDWYFPTAFLMSVFHRKGREAFENYLTSYLKSENDEASLLSGIRSILNKVKDVLPEELSLLTGIDETQVKSLVQDFIDVLNSKTEAAELAAKEAVFKMKVDEDKLRKYIEDFKNAVHFSDLELPQGISGRKVPGVFQVFVPKLALVKQNGTIFVGDFGHSELINSILYNEIRKLALPPQEISKLSEIGLEYDKLLLPREYYVEIMEELDYRRLPEIKELFFNEVWIGGRRFLFHWMNYIDHIYAVAGKDVGYYLQYEALTIEIAEELRSKDNEAVLKMRVEVPFFFDNTLKVAEYVLKR